METGLDEHANVARRNDGYCDLPPWVVRVASTRLTATGAALRLPENLFRLRFTRIPTVPEVVVFRLGN